MLRSLNHEWKQPVAYYFINNSCSGIDLQNTIFDVITKLQSISINIKAVTTDQGSNFTSFANTMNVSSQRPFFFCQWKKDILYI